MKMSTIKRQKARRVKILLGESDAQKVSVESVSDLEGVDDIIPLVKLDLKQSFGLELLQLPLEERKKVVRKLVKARAVRIPLAVKMAISPLLKDLQKELLQTPLESLLVSAWDLDDETYLALADEHLHRLVTNRGLPLNVVLELLERAYNGKKPIAPGYVIPELLSLLTSRLWSEAFRLSGLPAGERNRRVREISSKLKSLKVLESAIPEGFKLLVKLAEESNADQDLAES